MGNWRTVVKPKPKLKPCAHCGWRAKSVSFMEEGGMGMNGRPEFYGMYYKVICTDCFISTHSFCEEKDAIESWNKRV